MGWKAAFRKLLILTFGMETLGKSCAMGRKNSKSEKLDERKLQHLKGTIRFHDKSYRFTIERLCNILLYPTIDPRLLCKAQPTRISHNVTFIVDCSYLTNVKDLCVDDMGVWISKGSRKTCFSANISVGCVSIDLERKGDNHFVMHRTWHTHGASEDFRRLTVFIEGKHFSNIIPTRHFTQFL